jgi:ABC-type branched-subunit amino acid transport system ATPase component
VGLCRFEDVTVVFGGLRALTGLKFAVDSDDVVTGIIGPNGAGKSTALAVMMEAVKPMRGCVHVLGHQITRAIAPEQALYRE